jgi:RNA polymerase sigma-70 factor, ECF subfamily
MRRAMCPAPRREAAMTTGPRFEQLAVPHLEAAYNLAFWLVRSRPDAEDVVQDAYLRAFRAFDNLRGEDIRPWLLAIVRNVAYRWLSERRRGGNVVSLDESFGSNPSGTAGAPDIAADEPTAEEGLIRNAERDYVLRGLAELPPAFREIVVLREIEGLSYKDIAQVTGAPIGTVMSRLARGRTELRKVLSRLIEKDESNAV